MKRIPMILLLLAVAVVPAFAAGGHHGGPPPAGFAGPGGAPPSAAEHLTHLTRILDLTAAQVASAKPLAAALDAAVAPLHTQLKTQHEAVKTALDNNSDATTVGELVIAAHGTETKIKAAHDTFATAFEALLTADQLTKFQAIKAMHGRHRG